MTRFADPTKCPDCAHPIEYGDLACPTCDLPLRGTTAQRLFQTLTTADHLLAVLRTQGTSGHPTPAFASLGGLGTTSGPVPAAGPVPAPVPHGLSAASVPKILLGLGAACLLIAALVFLAVTWSVMGVGGRTATLVGFTALSGLLAAWMARRDLRGAAEALSLVSLGLLTMDLFGAREAGWLGDPSAPTFLIVLGLVLAVTGSAGTLAARRSPAGDLVGAQLVAGLGVLLLGYGVAANDRFDRSVALVLAVLVAAGACYLADRFALTFTTALSGLAAGLLWLAQLGSALEAVLPAGLRAMWLDLDAWQLLASAALMSLVVAVPKVPLAARVAAAATTYAVLTLTAVLPALDETATAAVLATLGALLVAGAVGWVLRPPWGLTAVLTQAVAGLATLVGLASIGLVAINRLGEAASAQWSGTTTGRLVGSVPTEVPAAWLAPLCLLGLIGTAVVLAKASPPARPVLAPLTDPRTGVVLLVASGIATLACYPVPVWTVVVALLAAAVGSLAWWLRSQAVVTLAVAGAYHVVTGAFLAGAVAVGWYDEWLTVVSLAGLLLMAGTVHLRARQADTSAVAGTLVPVALAGSVWTWGALVEGSEPWVALVGLALLSALVLTLSLYPDEWWACEAPVAARAGVEVGAAVAALPLGLVGVLLAEPGTGATWTAVLLTLAGAAVTALSLLRPDRRPLTWVGGGLLALASWVRLWDIGVREPEPYTLPTAVVLLALGVLHLRRNPAASTTGALGPGLGLALVPSLLWVLDEPASLRALLLGLACFGLVVAGLQVRWTAPVTSGALVGGLEVVRLATPYIGDAVPRWVLIGTAGAVLILMGVTWERRLQEARAVVGYMRRLR